MLCARDAGSGIHFERNIDEDSRDNMGAGFVKQLAGAGHRVRVTARDAAKAEAVATQYGAKAVPPPDAAGDLDLVVLAVPTARLSMR